MVNFECDAPTECIHRKQTKRKGIYYKYYCEYEISGQGFDYLCTCKDAQIDKLKKLGFNLTKDSE